MSVTLVTVSPVESFRIYNIIDYARITTNVVMKIQQLFCFAKLFVYLQQLNYSTTKLKTKQDHTHSWGNKYMLI
jgi:hypothetical protein